MQSHLLDDPQEWPSFSTPWQEGALASQAQQSGPCEQDLLQAPMWVSHVVLQGMYCATCALTIEDALRAVPGVQRVDVSAAAQRAKVVWDARQVRPSQWMAAVQRAGYQAYPARDASAREVRQAQQRKGLWRWLLASFCMMQVMMYAWPAYDAQPGDLLLEYERLLRWASWVICIPMLIFACGPFLSGAWRDIRQRRISMDLPVALGMLLTFAVSTIGTFDPHGVFGAEVFYDSLTMFVCFLLTGRWLELRLRERTAGALDAVLNRLPDSVEQLQPDGRFARVALRQLAVGQVLRILPGEAFPADGVLVQGHTQVDEALLTGESRPLPRAQGERVIAGSYNLRSAVQMRVEQVGSTTQFAQIVALMEGASTQKPRLAQLADRIAGPFLLVVLALAGAAAVYWWPTDAGYAVMVAAAVLIVTCPCALSLATPVAMLTAAGTLARHGVLVRNLQGLEALAQADCVVFDKTGTLTRDGLQVGEMAFTGVLTATQCEGLAAAVAAHSHHPVSRAVAAHGQAWAGQWQVVAVEEIGGQGVRVQVKWGEPRSETASAPGFAQGQAQWVRLGSASYAGGQDEMQRQGVAQLHSGSCVYLALEMAGGMLQPLAHWALQERLRPEAAGVVQALQQQGLQVQLLSGDSRAAVQQVGQAVGVDMWQAQCAPQTKLAQMVALQAQGRCVAMVGDGLNDGPVLAGSNVSFAFGRAVPLAQARADFVVLSENLQLVQHTLGLAQRTMRVVRQNLAASALYNALSIPLAMMGWMPAWLAGLGMALSSLLVVLNAARLTRPLPVVPAVDASPAPAQAPTPMAPPADVALTQSRAAAIG